MKLIQKLIAENDLTSKISSWDSNEQGIKCLLENGPEITLNFHNKTDDKYQITQFEAFLVETKNIQEASSFIISLTKQRRLGYVFPINALSTFEYLPDDEWASMYGSFALQFLVNDPGLFKHAVLPELSDNFTYNISDFYSDSFAVVVVGKEALSEHNITQSEIRLMLMEHGYHSCEIIDVSNLYSQLENKTITDSKIVIGQISSSIDKELSIKLDWLLSTALKEINPFSCFLSLYQVIESMSIKVFNACIEVIKDNDIIDTPWLLKEKLSSITNERRRLNLLFHSFLTSGISSELIDALQTQCNEFLIQNNLINNPTESLIESFYKVRNTIVHRQVELTPEAYKYIRNINLLVYEICFNLIVNLNIEKGKEEFRKNLLKEEQYSEDS